VSLMVEMTGEMVGEPTMSNVIPQYLSDKCIAYFGNDHWFFVKHPALNYECPYIWLKNGRDVKVIENLLAKDSR
jgi:hypothetical protein